MKVVKIGSVAIPLESYAVGGTAILGIRESGKTYAAKGIAEQLLDHGVPIVVFDPIGMWRWLKVPGTGSGGKGYKVVVAGGREPDLPLTPQSAPEIVRAAIRENIPLVLDLYSRQLSKADWRRIVQACFRTLLHENEGLRHIILEETAEFAPQKVLDGEAYAEVEKVVRMGGNYSLGITLINQRAQEVNKAILDLCENMVLMRQRGTHAIDSLEKFMDRLAPDQAAKIAKELPTLRQGECWIFTPDSDEATRARSALIHSFHPDRRKPQLTEKASAKRTDTADFVSRLSGDLQKLIEDQKANDPAALRQRIRQLESELRKPHDVTVDKETLALARAQAHAEGYTAAVKKLLPHFKAMGAWLEKMPRPPELEEMAPVTVTIHPKAPKPAAATVHTLMSAADTVVRRGRNGTEGDSGSMPKAERALLTVLAQYQADGVTKVRLSLLSGYSIKSSSFANALGALRSKGYATKDGEPIRPTHDGLNALGTWDDLPSGAALIEHWKRNLGLAERTMLDVLVKHYPGSLSKEQLSDESGYSVTSSSFANALGRLRSLELATRGADIRASEDLFG